MRTQGAFYADTAHSGGWVFYAAPNLFPFSANLVLTRNALGDYSFNRTAAGAETYQVVLNLADVKRLIEGPTNSGASAVNANILPFQEQFGVAAGTVGYPAGPSGIPPFSGASQLTPPTAQPAKGVMVTDVVVVYQVGVASLTSATLSLNRTVFANNVANAITNLPISATALSLTAQANPYVAVRSVTTPAFETADLSDINLEFQAVMANTGTLRIYGLGVHVNFNFN